MKAADVRVRPTALRQRVKAALEAPAQGWARIYNAQGELIAEMDPITRRRIL